MLEGITEIAEDTLDCPVRTGSPADLGGLAESVATAQFSTAVGLALFGAKQRRVVPLRQPHPFFIGRMTGMFKEWLNELF
jgi:cell division ATPase FtsA